ncbi:MAG TPA: ABC transporter permease subunit [Paraburkholderia sp.]|jgi:His/Glu/Gln/Arg/opine family amino acid ABC transporter permease subunit|nr:ABC transporter permease subunit [Paraburkholderia sp.]
MKLDQPSDHPAESDVSGEGTVSQLKLSSTENRPFGRTPSPASRAELKRRRLARTRSAAIQTLILAAIAAAVLAFLGLIWAGLRRHGIGFSLDFLEQPAGFNISEGLTIAKGPHGFSLVPFNSQQTYAQALLAGLYNTLVVTLISIVLATVLGVIVGVGGMARNWVVKNWAWGFVELVRNTPLLIQIIFWYFAVLLQLPSLADASLLHGVLIASRQGVFIAWLAATPVASRYAWFAGFAVAVFAVGVFVRTAGWRRVAFAASAAILALAVAFTGRPFSIDMPKASSFSVSGGAGFSPEMASLIIALGVNFAAYVAEVVRGALQSIDKGQWEAAAALGLGHRESLWVVVLPQAVRVIIPSLANLYVTVAKSTSFAIAIGFPDMFSVYGTVANQTGRALEGIIIVMVVYLLISLSISAIANLYNWRVMKKGAR